MTEEEIVADVVANMSKREGAIESWKKLKQGDLGSLHMAVGEQLREHYKLTEEDAPFRIIEKVWRQFNESD